MKWILEHIGFLDEEKLGCTIPLLNGEAHRWWNTIRKGTTADHLTWDFFLDSFWRKYLGEQSLNARKREFLDLVRGSMLVVEYELKFLRLS